MWVLGPRKIGITNWFKCIFGFSCYSTCINRAWNKDWKVLEYMSSQDEICSNIYQKWSDIYQNDLTLVEINTVTLNFGSDTCQIKVGIVQEYSDVWLLFTSDHLKNQLVIWQASKLNVMWYTQNLTVLNTVKIFIKPFMKYQQLSETPPT